MSVSGYQEFWVTGSRFYFQRDDDTNEGLLDLGVIKVVSPTMEVEKIELEDSDGGIRKIAAEAVTKMSETYEIECNNFSLDNLALLFLASSSSPATFTQAVTPIADVPHKAVVGPGKFVKLKNLTGDWLYNINTISVVNATAMTTTTTNVPLTEDTDWEWISKDRGIISILSTGSIADGDDLLITITPNALTGKRLVYPQTGSIINGHAMLVWGRDNNAYQTVREADVTISPSSGNFQVEDYSSLTLSAKVLSDVTEITEPAGRLLQFKGTLPA